MATVAGVIQWASLHTPAFFARPKEPAAVVVVTAPGEPRSGYGRLYSELAKRLGDQGMALLVVGLGMPLADLPSHHGTSIVEGWRETIAGGLALLRSRRMGVALVAVRGVGRVALPEGIRPILVLPPGPLSAPDSAPDLRVGVAEHPPSPLLERLLALVQDDGLSGIDPAWTVVAQSGRAADSPAGCRVIQAPPGVHDPFFRPVWEREWLISTLCCIVREDAP
ncbi:hypothetical protein [Streptomyces sp. VNUA24]|uniref:hypothetical protein n=1 Tax=Streptomyces sp. VNUA24 TaxID=3031131 RepID=UPI0023B841AE|nr:hypothetical protein [Streptomyces sp. VNUA24]WEH12243.1 hypothetical protein PYR72_00385 [Streptomyces sp. VNUA24]